MGASGAGFAAAGFSASAFGGEGGSSAAKAVVELRPIARPAPSNATIRGDVFFMAFTNSFCAPCKQGG